MISQKSNFNYILYVLMIKFNYGKPIMIALFILFILIKNQICKKSRVEKMES